MEPVWYTRDREGAEESGPFECKVLLEALIRGRIQPATEVRREGSAGWKALRAHPDFFGPPEPDGVAAATPEARSALAEVLAASEGAAPPAEPGRATFSWGRGFVHYAVFALVMLAAGSAPAVAAGDVDLEFVMLGGVTFVGMSLPCVLLLSYLVQTKRFRWAVALMLVLLVAVLSSGREVTMYSVPSAGL